MIRWGDVYNRGVAHSQTSASHTLPTPLFLGGSWQPSDVGSCARLRRWGPHMSPSSSQLDPSTPLGSNLNYTPFFFFVYPNADVLSYPTFFFWLYFLYRCVWFLVNCLNIDYYPFLFGLIKRFYLFLYVSSI